METWTYVVTLLLLLVTTYVLSRSNRWPRGPESRPGRANAGRTVVVTGSYGAGHDVAAQRIADVVRAEGREVDLIDIVDFYPWGAGRALRRLYFTQLTTCPRTWAWLLAVLAADDHAGRLATRLTRLILERLPRRRLHPHVLGADLVISTHPFASAALGGMRRDGWLSSPTTTFLTDPSVHELWVHPEVDRHLAIYDEAARQARELGARDVVIVRPFVLTGAASRTSAVPVRTPVGGRPMALVVGGSEGIGELLESACDIAGAGLLTPVVVCGRNEVLLAQARATPGVVGLPWQEDLRALIVAAEVVVQNAGGSTALEALDVGTPVVSYRCVPGHGVANAAALERDGLASWPRSDTALVDALTDALVAERRPPTSWARRPSISEVISGPTRELLPA